MHNLTSKRSAGDASSLQGSSGALLGGEDADIQIARRVLGASIPRSLPTIDGLAAATLFCRGSAAGGDHLEIVPLSENKIVFLIFETCGHRLPTSLITLYAVLKFSDHIRALQSPRTIIECVNSEILSRIAAGYYLTAFVGVLDLEKSTFTYSGAGHCPQLLYRKETGTMEQLPSRGTVIGIFERGFFGETTVRIFPGDWLLLFTDGMSGIFGDRDAHAGHNRFEELLKEELPDAAPEILADRLRARIERPDPAAGLHDDGSLLAVEVLTQSKRNRIKEFLGFPADAPMCLHTLNYFDEIDRVVGAILKSMDASGFADETIRRMKIALIELLANAILHGNKRDFTKKILVGNVVTTDEAIIAIMDEGEGFEPDCVPDPTLPENLEKDSGRGLFLVRHFVDKIDYNASGNRVTITKYHSGFKNHGT